MINFFSEEVDLPDLNFTQIEGWLNKLAINLNKEIDTLNYVFCSDDYLLKVNKKYLQHDYYTDIITFPFEYEPIKADLYLSTDRIKDNATSLKTKYEQELLRVIVHGFLHMCGFDDKDPSSQKEMRQKENESLKLLESTKV